MFFVLLFSLNLCLAQDVLIEKKDGTRIYSHISATSKTDIYTRDDGTISFKQMSSITFPEKTEQGAKLYNNLEAAGVIVSFGSVSGGEVIQESKLKAEILAVNQTTTTNSDIDARIEKFRVQSLTGKSMQLIGMGLSIASIFVSQNGDVDLASGMAIGGAVVYTSGFFIDLDALRHLRKKR